MSEENVDLLHRAIDAMNRRDIDAFLELTDPNVEAWNRDDWDAWIRFIDPELKWSTAVERVLEGSDHVWRGHGGAREAWEAYRGEAFERLDVRIDEFRDFGDSVLLLGQIKAVGRSSQLEVESELAQLLTIRNGRIIIARDFLSHSEGLEAAGLSE